MKTPVFWATPEIDVYGNALGYQHHARMMKKYSEPYLEYKNDAAISLMILSADHFVRLPGKVNVLFTMWEFMDLPESYIKAVNKADVIIVPCTFCKELFRRYTDKPIYVCREGVESDQFPFYDRMTHNPPRDGKKFRFLWSGAPNQRKGYQYVLEAIKIFEKVPEVEIYIKTTAKTIDLLKIEEKKVQCGDDPKFKERVERLLERYPKLMSDQITYWGEHKNIIFDTRKLPFDELRELYNSTHCFLMPTLGEGWGLILSEMMATGCPCLTTMETGIKDFCDEEVAFGIDTKVGDVDFGLQYGGLKTRAYFPDVNDFVGKMIGIMKHYGFAIAKGAKASERIHRKFTWQRSGQRLGDIIKEIHDAYKC